MTEALTIARRTRAGRLAEYIGEMFPVAVHVPFGFATFFATYFSLQALAGEPTLAVSVRAIVGATTIVLFMLLLRVYDELKDVESDTRLGRAGDPRYKDRAIVTGRVRVEDIEFLRWAVTVVLFALNVALFTWVTFGAFLFAFFFTWLSFKWYFYPAISKNLLLAFATHSPLTLVLLTYVVALFAVDATMLPPAEDVVLLVIATWFPIAGWETSRKLRAPEDETDYQTYSKMLGVRRAAALPVFFVGSSAFALIRVALSMGVSPLFACLVLAVALVVVGACVRFARAPSARTAKVQPFTEAYSLVTTLGLVVALVLAHGVTWQ